MSNNSKKQRPHSMAVHLVAGGAAGLVESSICHPFDTIKTQLQLQQSSSLHVKSSAQSVITPNISITGSDVTKVKYRAFSSVTSQQVGLAPNRPAIQPPTGAIGMARSIVLQEGVPSLYKGLTAVWSAVIPKMSALNGTEIGWDQCIANIMPLPNHQRHHLHNSNIQDL